MKNASLRRARSAAASLALTGVLAAAGSTALAAGGGTSVGGDGGGGGGSASGGGGNAVFPVRAAHSYGDGLGAGRGHQGVDILARCGKRVVTAKRGRVKMVDYEGAAGNYVVIAGRRKAKDTVYMHLRAPSKLREGTRVPAGTRVGRVGQTGRATGCNLHFEMWSNPGWYSGGSPVDPKPSLKRWDRNS